MKRLPERNPISTPAGAPDPTLARTRKELFVRQLFDSLSARYDRFNSLASLGLHRLWRAKALQAMDLPPRGTLVDFCCGTGDFLDLAARRLGANWRLVGLDFSSQMLAIARSRLSRLGEDGRIELRLCNVEFSGLPSDHADAVTCGFALRNVESLENTFREMYRVLRPGGRLGLLELSQPEHPLLRKGFWIYLNHVLPYLARPVIRERIPLSYLSSSVRGFRSPAEVVGMLTRVGFREAEARPVFLGVCQIYTATKAV
jgi:demethylmenaquinone methyltransferase/2-methoxy-6-polyprenyl-1,4-benzoquinol methylase